MSIRKPSLGLAPGHILNVRSNLLTPADDQEDDSRGEIL